MEGLILHVIASVVVTLWALHKTGSMGIVIVSSIICGALPIGIGHSIVIIAVLVAYRKDL